MPDGVNQIKSLGASLTLLVLLSHDENSNSQVKREGGRINNVMQPSSCEEDEVASYLFGDEGAQQCHSRPEEDATAQNELPVESVA